MSRVLATAFLVALFGLAGVTTILVAGRVDPAGPPPTTLADRINGACRAGYVMTDWSTLGAYGDPLPSTVIVECSSTRKDRYGEPVRAYRTAVER